MISLTVLIGLLLSSTKVFSYDERLAKTAAFLSSQSYCKEGHIFNRDIEHSTEDFIPTLSLGDAGGMIGFSGNLSAIFVVPRGSKSVTEWIVHAETTLAKFDKCTGCKINSGFYVEFDLVIGAVKKEVSHLLSAYPQFRIVVAGHSVGAAVATIVAADLASSGFRDVSLVNFGSPRVGNAEFASWASSQVPDVTRVTHFQDFAPHFPSEDLGYQHLSGEVYEDEQHHLTTECRGHEDPICATKWSWGKWPWTSVDDHLLYLNRNMHCDLDEEQGALKLDFFHIHSELVTDLHSGEVKIDIDVGKHSPARGIERDVERDVGRDTGAVGRAGKEAGKVGREIERDAQAQKERERDAERAGDREVSGEVKGEVGGDEGVNTDTEDSSDVLLRQAPKVPDASKIPDKASKIPDKSSKVPDKASKIPDKSSKVPDKASKIPDKSSKVPDKASKIPDNTPDNPVLFDDSPDVSDTPSPPKAPEAPEAPKAPHRPEAPDVPEPPERPKSPFESESPPDVPCEAGDIGSGAVGGAVDVAGGAGAVGQDARDEAGDVAPEPPILPPKVSKATHADDSIGTTGLGGFMKGMGGVASGATNAAAGAVGLGKTRNSGVESSPALGDSKEYPENPVGGEEEDEVETTSSKGKSFDTSEKFGGPIIGGSFDLHRNREGLNTGMGGNFDTHIGLGPGSTSMGASTEVGAGAKGTHSGGGGSSEIHGSFGGSEVEAGSSAGTGEFYKGSHAVGEGGGGGHVSAGKANADAHSSGAIDAGIGQGGLGMNGGHIGMGAENGIDIHSGESKSHSTSGNKKKKSTPTVPPPGETPEVPAVDPSADAVHPQSAEVRMGASTNSHIGGMGFFELFLWIFAIFFAISLCSGGLYTTRGMWYPPMYRYYYADNAPSYEYQRIIQLKEVPMRYDGSGNQIPPPISAGSTTGVTGTAAAVAAAQQQQSKSEDVERGADHQQPSDFSQNQLNQQNKNSGSNGSAKIEKSKGKKSQNSRVSGSEYSDNPPV